jgi:molybdate transport system substrate-binding protein
MSISRKAASSIHCLLGLMLIGASAQAAEIKVLASAAVKEAYQEVVPNFEKKSGHKINTVWDGTANILKRLRDGETPDIVLLAAPELDKLIAEGKLAAESRTDIAKSGIGVAVRSGLPKPDVSSGEAVKQAVLSAKSVAYSTGPSGIYIISLFQKMGISEQIKKKVTQTPSGVQVGELLARGDADLGFQQVSELIHVKGIDFLGPLPADIQHTTIFSAGLHKATKDPEAAKTLLQFLTGPEAAGAIRKAGMEPG